MTDVFAIGEISMINSMQQLDIISHNLANATTGGYKREIPLVRSFADQFDLGVDLMSQVSAVTDNTPPTLSQATDFSQGALNRTGNALDVAIEGQGFFEFYDRGQRFYSRQGNFQLDAAGRLVSANNMTVNGLGGEIRLTSDQPRIDHQGMLWDGEVAVAQLRIVNFTDPSVLVKQGNGVYRVEGSARAQTLLSPAVRQGFLETSNVEVTDEMVRMMTTVRHFEATQHVIRGYDDMLGIAVETIAEF